MSVTALLHREPTVDSGDPRPTVFTVAVGCRVNQSESEGFAAELAARGFTAARDATRADLVVVNTCAVTGAADTDGRKLVRRIHRANPGARIVVTGCQAEREAEALAALPGVRLVVGNGGKQRLAEWAATLDGSEAPRIERPALSDLDGFVALGPDTPPTSQARPLVKVQDGCDRSCAFCVIPAARGASRSHSAEGVLAELVRLAAAGFEEAVLTGIDLGSWGQDLDPATDLAALLDRIDAERPVRRVRLSSLDPRDLSGALAERLARFEWICPHLHLSLQTGSPDLHRRMGRGRFPEALGDHLERIRRSRPDLAVGLDVMSGFPGESEDDHALTLDWVRNQPVTHLHVFPYSPRPGTAAFDWLPSDGPSFDSPVVHAVVERRARELRTLGTRARLAFHQRQVGCDLDVVVERVNGSEAQGTSGNYVGVRWPVALPPRIGSRTRVRVTRAAAEGCTGIAS